MRYIPHSADDVERMLAVIGVPGIEDLFRSVPEKLRLDRPLDVPAALSEQDLVRLLRTLADRNAHTERQDWFLGAGTYAHFAPSTVDALASRSEFTTSYTPYQPEISQGTLQAIFEWQTMLCSLTALDVTNASLYDGASAAAEGALMAMRVTRRNRVVLAGGMHPHYREVVRTYLTGLGAELVELGLDARGRSEAVAPHVDDETACVLMQSPNFLGGIDDWRGAAEAAHEHGALLVAVVAEALSLALVRPPGECGADIACGEAQSFGVPMSFGGPHVGFLACRQKMVRQLPGRLAGETVDAAGKRGFVLTLSTREQHIRRERATSNICTNEGLCLLMATIYLALLGRRGLRRLAEINLAKAHYARQRVAATPGLALLYDAPVFNEFAVRVPDSSQAALGRALEDDIVGGLDLETHASDAGPAVLVAVTELCSRDAIDRLVAALAGAGS